MPVSVLLVGTTKCAFVLRSDDRKSWTVSGPHCGGWPINHVVGDPQTGRLYAGGGSESTGAGIWRSGDGEHWQEIAHHLPMVLAVEAMG